MARTYTKPRDLTGQRFSRLTVIERSPVNQGGRPSKYSWLCQCDCGTLLSVYHYSLTHGNSRSCGCLKNERIKALRLKHGLSETVEYRIWEGIRNRCLNPNNHAYAAYGGRGITLCERWDQFEHFLEDVGKRPSPLHSIDRYPNNNGNYEPGNVRWATSREQNNNRRDIRMVTYQNRTQSVCDWARELGINTKTLRHRIFQAHMPLDDAMQSCLLSASSRRDEAGLRRRALTQQQFNEVLAMTAAGYTQIAIATHFATDRHIISKIQHGRTYLDWQPIPDAAD